MINNNLCSDTTNFFCAAPSFFCVIWIEGFEFSSVAAYENDNDVGDESYDKRTKISIGIPCVVNKIRLNPKKDMSYRIYYCSIICLKINGKTVSKVTV